MKNKEEYWSKFAEQFEQKNKYVVGEKDMDIVLESVSKLQPLNTTLELGCGNGTYSKIIAKKASNLTVTDLSKEMVNVTKTRLKQAKNVTVEQAIASTYTIQLIHLTPYLWLIYYTS